MRTFLLSHLANYWTPLYARGLRDRGHDVLVASFDEGTLEGVPTVCVGIQPWQEHKRGHITRAWRVRRVMEEFAPDVVLATYVISNGLTAAIAGRRPLVVSAHGFDLLLDSAYRGPTWWARRALLAWVCRRADAVHVVSDEMVRAARGLGVDAARVTCIPVGIDLARFPTGPNHRAEAGHVSSILCTRRHEPIYDNETLLDALGLLAGQRLPFRATMVGPGLLTEPYRERASRLGLDGAVDISGGVPAERIPGLLASHDIFVSASLVDGTSSALLEAMSVGLVPVVSDIPANRAWIEHGRNGLLFPCGDASALAAALRRAAEDTALIDRARTENRAQVETTGDLGANLDRLDELLRRVAGR